MIVNAAKIKENINKCYYMGLALLNKLPFHSRGFDIIRSLRVNDLNQYMNHIKRRDWLGVPNSWRHFKGLVCRAVRVTNKSNNPCDGNIGSHLPQLSIYQLNAHIDIFCVTDSSPSNMLVNMCIVYHIEWCWNITNYICIHPMMTYMALIQDCSYSTVNPSRAICNSFLSHI